VGGYTYEIRGQPGRHSRLGRAEKRRDRMTTARATSETHPPRSWRGACREVLLPRRYSWREARTAPHLTRGGRNEVAHLRDAVRMRAGGRG
jgi:hypothetical protein